MSTADFFVLEYDWQSYGLPAFIAGMFNHDEFEWNVMNPPSLRDVRISRSYEFHVTDSSIKRLNFDFYDPRSPIVSMDFLSVCDELSVEYRAVPLKVSLAGVPGAIANYFVFLPCQSESLMDREQSEFQEDRVVETGEVMMDRSFPGQPVYSWIKRFVPKRTPLQLFHCTELMQVVVSRRFADLASERGIKGAGFVPIDESFRYDPWGEIS